MASDYARTSFIAEINRLANGGVNYSNGTAIRGADLAANIWAGTTGLGLIEALNVKAGNNDASWQRDLNAVCNQLGGTTGLEARDALAARPS